MRFKRFILKAAIGILRAVYAPMKLRPAKNKITIISRQSNRPTMDIALLCDYLKKNYPNTKCVCLCRLLEKPGIITYPFHILTQMWHMADSKAVVLDGYCIAASNLNHREETAIIQMWHSLAAIKKFGHQTIDMPSGSSREIAEAMNMHGGYDFVLAPGEATGKYFCKAFDIDSDKLIYLGLPRIDEILQGKKGNKKAEEFARQVKEEFGIPETKEIVLYAPTFRKGRSGAEAAAAIKEALDEERYELVVKMHPLYDEEGLSDRTYSSTQWLRACDRIITDYSALAIEAALTDKPVYYYLYDLEEYEAEVGINVNMFEEMPRASARTAAELAAKMDKEYDFEALHRLRDKYISVDTENCTGQLAEFIIEQMEK